MSGVADLLFGQGSDLTVLQMALRAIVVFWAALFMVRVSGRRSFGQHGCFDACMTILLGAVLSRAVVGASPFLPTLVAGLVIVLMHRLIAVASIRWDGFEVLVNGRHRTLVEEGVCDAGQMRRGLLTRHDLHEAVRRKTGDEDTPIERAVLERDGTISVKVATDERVRRSRALARSRLRGSAAPRRASRPERATS